MPAGAALVLGFTVLDGISRLEQENRRVATEEGLSLPKAIDLASGLVILLPRAAATFDFNDTTYSCITTWSMQKNEARRQRERQQR